MTPTQPRRAVHGLALMLLAVASTGAGFGGSGRPDFETARFEALPPRPTAPPKPDRQKPLTPAEIERKKRRKAQRKARKR